MRLSIVIPVYNEEKTIIGLLQKVRLSDTGMMEKEIIVVDDCSKDKTRGLLSQEKGIKLLLHEQNRGKGSAVRTGLAQATGDVILIQDADLEYSPDDYPLLLAPVLNNKTDVVYGSRYASTEGHFKSNKKVYFFHYMGNKILTLATNVLYNANITDMETCYKVFTRKALTSIGPLRARRFDFEPEITAKFLKKKFKIMEVPIHYYSRDFQEGKKITWRDGIKALYYLIKYRFVN